MEDKRCKYCGRNEIDRMQVVKYNLPIFCKRCEKLADKLRHSDNTKCESDNK